MAGFSEGGRRIAAVFVLLGGIVPGAAFAAQKSVVLVVHPVVNVPDGESKAIATELAASMGRRYEARVFAAERSRLPQSLADDCVSDMRCAGELADRLSADQVVFLVMVKVGTKIQVDATWVDPQAGRTVPRDTFELDANGDGRTRVIAEVAPSMIPRGEIPVAGASSTKPNSKPEPALPPPSASARAEATAPPSELSGVAIAAWVASGTSVLALGTGLALVLSGIGEYDDLLQSTCLTGTPSARCQEQLDRFGTRSTVANVLLISAGLAAGTAIGLFAADADATITAAIPSPAITSDGFAMVWGGRF